MMETKTIETKRFGTTDMALEDPYTFEYNGTEYAITKVGANYHDLKMLTDGINTTTVSDLQNFNHAILDAKVVEYPTMTSHRCLILTVTSEYYKKVISFGKIRIVLKTRDPADKRRMIAYITTNTSHFINADDPSRASIVFDFVES